MHDRREKQYSVCPASARITSGILISHWSIALSIKQRSVPSSLLALLSDDTSRDESVVGRQVAAVLPKSNSLSYLGPECSVASSRPQ